MRAPIASILAIFALAGCVSGTRTIVVREYPAATPVPAPAPAPRPIPAPLPTPRRLAQLEVSLGSPAAGKVPVQTNRAAYVAIFEIVPQQGVTLLHPATPKQSRAVMSGLSWVPVLAGPAPTAQRVSNSGRPRGAVRYIYALASDTPLRIPDRAIEPGYLEQLLGPAAFRAASPQAAVNALSRNFAPKVSDEQWAEDLFAVEPRNSSAPPRVARVYCWNGRMYEVPEDMADRAWCPERPGTNNGGGVMPTPARPDSVVGNNGRRIGPRVPRKPGRTADAPDAKPEQPERPSTPRNDQAEKEKKEKADKERADKEREEKEKKDKADKAKADSDRAEKEREEKEKKDKAEKEKADKEREEKGKKDKADKEKADNDRAEKEKKDKEEADRLEREKADKQKKDEADKAEREKADKEKAEKEKADREKAEKEKADREKADKEKADREKADKEKADKGGKPEKDDDSAEDDNASDKPDEADKGAGGDTGPAKDEDRKADGKAKPKADSTKASASRGTPRRGRSTP